MCCFSFTVRIAALSKPTGSVLSTPASRQRIQDKVAMPEGSTRKPGRPKKVVPATVIADPQQSEKKKRGRPRKSVVVATPPPIKANGLQQPSEEKKKRGRPKKAKQGADDDDFVVNAQRLSPQVGARGSEKRKRGWPRKLTNYDFE